MHQQVIRFVIFLTHFLRYAGCGRHSRYAGITDQRVDLRIFRQEQVEELHKEYTASRSYKECKCSHNEDVD